MQRFGCILWCVVAESAKNTSRVKACSHVRGLVGYIKIADLGDIVVKEQDIAGLDVSVDDARLSLLVEELKPSRGTHGDPHALHP